MIDLDIIEESCSPWSSPVILVKKPDESMRFVVDYRKLNDKCYTDAFQLPRIDNLIDKMGKAKYITKFDISKAYWQIELTEDSKQYSAFTVQNALYQFKVLPFGLASAASSFQRLMEHILRNFQKFAGTYFDDITVFSET